MSDCSLQPRHDTAILKRNSSLSSTKIWFRSKKSFLMHSEQKMIARKQERNRFWVLFCSRGIWWALWFHSSCWEQKESLWGTDCQSNLKAFQWLHTSKVRSRVRWMDIWSLAGFQGLKGMHSASPHYQGKTQPNQNGDEAEKKQEMAETDMRGGGIMFPFLASQT